MSDETTKRDILADILNDPHTGMIRGMNELSKLIHARPNDSSTKDVAKRPVVGQQKKRERSRKHKTTHYLTKEVFDNLDEAKADIRSFLPEDSKSKATKSSIVESAITVVLHEFEKKGKDSVLIQELLKKRNG